MEMIQILKDLTSNILEEMFFLTQETEPLIKNFDYKYAVRIKDNKADIVLMFCEKTAKQMTENFQGDDNITISDIHDTLKECVNIIVGNFLGTIYPDVPKRINIPEMITDVKCIDINSYKSAVLYFREEPLDILLKIL